MATTTKKKKKKSPRRRQVKHASQEAAIEALMKMDSRDIVRVHHLRGVLGLEFEEKEPDPVEEQKKREKEADKTFSLMAKELKELREEIEAQKAKDQVTSSQKEPPVQA